MACLRGQTLATLSGILSLVGSLILNAWVGQKHIWSAGSAPCGP